MADKSFGVKQLNLIGSTGTPTIESPGNLNLNAGVVAISTDATVGGKVGIGTTTPTASLDINGTLNVTGVSTFQSHVDLGDNDFLRFGDGLDLQIWHNVNSNISNYTGSLTITNNQIDGSIYINADSGAGNGTMVEYIRANGATGEVNLSHYGTEKFSTKSNGIAVSGIITAISGVVTYYGDGSNLTSLNATQLTTGTVSGNRGVTAGSSSSSFVEYNGTTRTSGQFYGGTSDPNGTTRLNYSGNFYATNFYGDGSNLTNIGGNVVNVLSIDSNGDLIHEYYEDTETDTIDLEDGVVGAASSIYAMFMTTKPITPVISEFSWLTSTVANAGFDSQGGGFYSNRPNSGKLTVTI